MHLNLNYKKKTITQKMLYPIKKYKHLFYLCNLYKLANRNCAVFTGITCQPEVSFVKYFLLVYVNSINPCG